MMLGDHIFTHLYKEFIIFIRSQEDSLVQISGTNIFNYLSDKFGRQALYAKDSSEPTTESPFTKKQLKDARSHKFNLQNDADMYQSNLIKQESGEYINRNRLFYCTHQNRGNAFFRKHALNSTISTEDLADKIFSE